MGAEQRVSVLSLPSAHSESRNLCAMGVEVANMEVPQPRPLSPTTRYHDWLPLPPPRLVRRKAAATPRDCARPAPEVPCACWRVLARAGACLSTAEPP